MPGQLKEAADTRRHESSRRHDRSEEAPPYQVIKGIGLAGRARRQRASCLATPSYEPDHMDLHSGMNMAEIARIHIVSRRLMIASADGGCSGRITYPMNRSQGCSNSNPQSQPSLSPRFSTGISAAPPHGTVFWSALSSRRRWDLHDLVADHTTLN